MLFLYEYYESQQFVSSIFVGYSKAFDTIDHTILIEKLKLFDLDSNNLNWFKDYLTNRTQIVKLDHSCFSQNNKVMMGVLPGSILGPLLFIIFVNDLAYNLSECDSKLTVFADDMILLYC